MTRKLMIIVGIMSVGILLTESSISHAASNAVPKLDTRLSCESHGRKAITHGNSNLSIRHARGAKTMRTKCWSSIGRNMPIATKQIVTAWSPKEARRAT